MHEVTSRGLRAVVVECLEVAVVTQGRTLDEAVANLKEALALHFEGEDPGTFGLTATPRLVITCESALDHGTAAPSALR